MLSAWQITDNDVWAAATLDEAREAFVAECGEDCREFLLDEPMMLGDNYMKSSQMYEEDGTPSGETLFDVVARMTKPGLVVCWE